MESIPEDSIPDAPDGTAPGLEIASKRRKRGPGSTGGQSVFSTFSVMSTTLQEKGLDGAPVAEKHVSRKNGKPYYRYKDPKTGKFIKTEKVIKLGFAWYPKKDKDDKVDPTKGYLFGVNAKGTLDKFFKGGFAKARELLPDFESDIANLKDFDDDEGFMTPDEDAFEDCIEG
mmetsp:Transcript_51618/g.81989  ORF Transcript_51618/g.81989 Transcript_51618/m.81989 type:complete len:172 (+) Transcript_51618:71-586(+)|eukprot:CAMPEP_0169130232 /NCGR_PEP_ID=MMETSP1015-20121227/37586_1 /TAXON_ID=342587 /ORGANISM="Karlodinium micrum, Strain CCMP2283" /LENGTH=171 /DNA_ID=CAMNT_0009194377 /DNA_START=66 /DNA_END=581 /DNA_ORIENTATION=-